VGGRYVAHTTKIVVRALYYSIVDGCIAAGVVRRNN